MQRNFILNDNVHNILCLSCDIQKFKTTAKLSEKKAEASVVLMVFKGAIYDVKVYSVTVSFCRST